MRQNLGVSMDIGILQCGHLPDEVRAATGDYDACFHRLFEGHGLSFTTWNVVDMEFPPSVHAAAGWLITGSKHGAYDDLPFIPPLEAFLRRAFENAVPIVGICFGHQILAQALGGRVQKHPGGWAVGRRAYTYEGRELHLNAWHQDQVCALPAAAEVVGSNDFTRYAALRYGTRALTVQPHPEFGHGVIRGLITHRAPGVVPEDRLSQARGGLDQPLDNAIAAAEFARFWKEAPHG